jgi:hypothetical protein
MIWIRLLIFFAAGGVLMACFFVGVSINERRRAAGAPVDWQPDERSAAARDVVWGASADPEDCPHDDVLEDWSERLDTWYGGIQPAVPKILDQGGVCRKCGARVVRHGSPYAWSEWMLDPTEAEG